MAAGILPQQQCLSGPERRDVFLLIFDSPHTFSGNDIAGKSFRSEEVFSLFAPGEPTGRVPSPVPSRSVSLSCTSNLGRIAGLQLVPIPSPPRFDASSFKDGGSGPPTLCPGWCWWVGAGPGCTWGATPALEDFRRQCETKRTTRGHGAKSDPGSLGWWDDSASGSHHIKSPRAQRLMNDTHTRTHAHVKCWS